MTDYRVDLHDCPGIDQATQSAMLNDYHAMLEHDQGGVEGLNAAYHAWQDVCCAVRFALGIASLFVLVMALFIAVSPCFAKNLFGNGQHPGHHAINIDFQFSLA